MIPEFTQYNVDVEYVIKNNPKIPKQLYYGYFIIILFFKFVYSFMARCDLIGSPSPGRNGTGYAIRTGYAFRIGYLVTEKNFAARSGFLRKAQNFKTPYFFPYKFDPLISLKKSDPYFFHINLTPLISVRNFRPLTSVVSFSPLCLQNMSRTISSS